MKKVLLLLCLLLTLSACGTQTSPVATPPKDTTEEPSAPAVTPEPPEKSETTQPAEPEEAHAEVSQPDTPEPSVPEAEPEVSPLPALPLPVYCYEDTAVDAKGNVLLQLPDHELQVLSDSYTGHPRGILAVDRKTAAITGLYDLTGQPILENLLAYQCGWYADLFWYSNHTGYTVRCLSEDLVLYENMSYVMQVDDALLVQPPFWNTCCVLLDGSGQVLRELDRGFRLVSAFRTPERTWLVMEAKNGEQTLCDAEGNTYLGRFYDEVVQVQNNRAVVRDGSTWLAVDLTSGSVLLRRSTPFTLLTDSVLLDTDVPGQQQLADLHGNLLYDKPLTDARLLDADGDGFADWIASKETRNDLYGTVLLDLQGQELLVLEAEPTTLVPVSSDLLFTATSTGEGAFHQEGVLHNIRTGDIQPLLTGRFLQASVVETSEQSLLLCQGRLASDEPISRLFTLDGEELAFDQELLSYAGGDVLITPEGLLCLNGTWLYRK